MWILLSIKWNAVVQATLRQSATRVTVWSCFHHVVIQIWQLSKAILDKYLIEATSFLF